MKPESFVQEHEPDEGWYKSDTREKLEKAVTLMQDGGMTDQNIDQALEYIIGSMMSEYGE